jgi:hypothetical protein
MSLEKAHAKLEQARVEKEKVRNLVVSGSYTAQFINDKLFNSKDVPEFKQWSNDTLFLGIACLAVTYAKAIKLPEKDFTALVRSAYDMLEAEVKSGPGPAGS